MPRGKTLLLVAADYARGPSLAAQVGRAFEQLGWKVHRFNYRFLQLHRSPMLRYLVNALLWQRANQIKPNLIFVIKGEALQEGTIQGIKETFGCKAVNWMLDEPFGIYGKYNKVENLEEYNHCFHFDFGYAKKIGALGIPASYLPAAADPFIHRELIPVAKRTYAYDVGFIGTHYPEREQLLSYFTRHKLFISGYKWDTLPKTSPLTPQVSPRIVKANKSFRDCAEMCRLFNLTKINLNHQRPEYKFGGVNVRVFECLATNSFLITSNVIGMEKLFRTGKEIVEYASIPDLQRKVAYYLGEEAERHRIAKKGWARVRQEHTMNKRMATVLKTVGESHGQGKR